MRIQHVWVCLAFCGLHAGLGRAQQRTERGDLLGYALDGLEDLDGDGLGEILIGAPDSHAYAGSAWVVSGGTGEPLMRFIGEAPGARLGNSARGLGDLDGDGVQDVALSSPGASEIGALEAHSGADGRRLWSARGSRSGFNPGRGLCRLDDVDGDGVADVGVLAQQTPAQALASNVPALAVLSGRDGSVLAFVVEELMLPRPSAAIATAGDVDGDGKLDVLLSGARATSARAFVEIRSGKDLRVIHPLEGGTHDLDFGSSMSTTGDADGDGFDDVLVGAPRELYSSSKDEDDPILTRLYSGASGRPVRAFRSEGHGLHGVGCALASAGDVDCDGRGDFFIGSTFMTGTVELHSGRTGGRLRRWVASSNAYDDYHFGQVIASLGDLDGDCIRDLAIGVVNVHASHLPCRVEVHSVEQKQRLFRITLVDLEAAWEGQQVQRRSPAGR